METEKMETKAKSENVKPVYCIVKKNTEKG